MEPLAFIALIRQVAEQIGTEVKTMNAGDEDSFSGETIDGATFEGTITDGDDSLEISVEYLGRTYIWTIKPH